MHVVRFNKMSMDPSSTGPIRWSSETNFDQVVPFEYSIRIPNVLLTPEEYIPVYISMSVPKDATAPVHFKGYELSTKRQVYLVSNGQPSGPIETTSFQYESEILAARTERPSTRSRAAAARRAAALAAEPPPVKMQIETDPPGIPLFDKDSFPMVLQPGESRIGMARLRMRERGFHAWSYGETGQNAVFRIQFFLAFKVRCTLSSGRVGYARLTLRSPAVLHQERPVYRERQVQMAADHPLPRRRLSRPASSAPRPVPLPRKSRQLRRV